MKEKFEELLRDTEREGIENVIGFLATSDFYMAPASAVMRFHNCCSGGLADHSWKVYEGMVELNSHIPEEKRFPPRSIVLVGLLHDVCKVNVYQPNMLASGKRSEDKPWKFDDKFPLGHGEKSVALLLRLGLELTDEEILAIRWHMNAFDAVPYSKSSESWNNLAVLCFLADYFSTKFLEKVKEG